MPSFVAFILIPITAFASCCFAFLWVLPRLKSFGDDRSVFRVVPLALVQTVVALGVFVSMGGVVAYSTVWIAIGGGAKSIPGVLIFATAVAVAFVYIVTAAIIGLGSAIGGWKLEKKRGAFTGAAAVTGIQLPATVLVTVGLLAFTANQHLWGYINKSGTFVIEPRYGNASHFKNGVAQVASADYMRHPDKAQMTFIDKTGKDVVPPKGFSPLTRFRDQQTMKVDDNPADYEDDGSFSAGRYVITRADIELLPFSEGLAVARKKGQVFGWGFVDKSYKFVIPSDALLDARHFKEGLAPAAMNLDYDGKMTSADESGAMRKWGFVDRTGKWVIPPTYASAKPFSEGLAVVGVPEKDSYDNKYGYIDKTGKMVIPASFAFAESFSEGLAAACK
jgi:hypothetical protein